MWDHQPGPCATRIGVRAGGERPVERAHGAAVPPVTPGVVAAKSDAVLQVDGDRQPKLAEDAQQPQGVGVVEHDAALVLACQTNVVEVDCGLEPLNRVGALGVRGVAQHEALGGVGPHLQDALQRNAALRSGGHGGLVRPDVILRLRYVPREQPQLVDAVLVHVLDDLLSGEAVVVGVVVGVYQHVGMSLLGPLASGLLLHQLRHSFEGLHELSNGLRRVR